MSPAGEELPATRWTQNDINLAAVGLPAFGDPLALEVGVGVLDSAVVLLLEFVDWRAGVGAADGPELLDEIVAVFVTRQSQEGVLLFLADDVPHVFCQPFLVALR